MTGSVRHAADGRRAFSLVELLVTMVIISIVASLSAVGLAGIRTRTKVAKTRTTIRKLHEVVVPRSLEYLDRRVDDAVWSEFDYELDRSGLDGRDPRLKAGSPVLAAWKRLTQIRGMMVHEMPDQWIDVRRPAYPVDPSDSVPSNPKAVSTPVIERYLRHVDALVTPADPSRNTPDKVLATLGLSEASAETLYLQVALGSLDADALEPFREDEIGDGDGDGAREFLDGFGRPIHFLRWAPGHARQAGLPVTDDPFDPYRLGKALGAADSSLLTPLIVSAGPDEQFSLRRDASRSIEEQGAARVAMQPGGLKFLPLPFDPFDPIEAGGAIPGNRGHLDNISNLGMGSP
ncbi:MAG: type II secretion system protein [Planctomycetia bacterium]|nr:type II secretion system protein [Planctomycetia bacterium]